MSELTFGDVSACDSDLLVPTRSILALEQEANFHLIVNRYFT